MRAWTPSTRGGARPPQPQSQPRQTDALHARWRETFTAGGIDLFTFQEKIGLKPDESLKGRFVRASALLDDGDEIKSYPDQPRDRLGRWTNGGGFLAPDDGLTNIGGSTSSSSPSGAQFWGGVNRDEVTKQHFNGKFEVEIPLTDRAAIARHSTVMFGRELAPHEWGELIGAPDGEKLECRNLPMAVAIRKTPDSDASSIFVSLMREVRKGSEYGDDKERKLSTFTQRLFLASGGL